MLDVLLPDLPGTEVFKQLRTLAPDLPVIFLTAHGRVDLAVESIAGGAFEFVEKEDLVDRLSTAVQRAHEQILHDERDTGPFRGIIAERPGMRAVLRSLEKALDSKVPVMLRGESGTGKEVVAKGLHNHSVRREAGHMDLFYRLAVSTVELPPLRDRTEDVLPLAEHSLRQASRGEGRRPPKLDKRVLQLLCGHSFPGNVRELENVISFAGVTCQGPVITMRDLPRGFLRLHALSGPATPAAATAAPPSSPVNSGPGPAATSVLSSDPALFPTLRELEDAHIKRAVAMARGNKTKAARMLGVSQMTLYRKLEALRVID